MAKGMPSKYKPEFCDLLIKHMSEGLTFTSFAAVAKVNRDTLYAWLKVHEEFAHAKSLAESELQLFDEKLLRAIITGKVAGANITGLIFKFKNCHGWTDRPPEQSITINNIQAPVAEAIERVKSLETATLLKIVKDYEKKAN